MQYDLEIIGFPKYAVKNNRVINKVRPSVELRPKVYNGIYYYNLNSKKVRKDSLEFERPKDVKFPF